MSEEQINKPKIKNFKNRSNHLRKGDAGHIKDRVNMEWRLDSQRMSEPFGEMIFDTKIDDVIALLSQSRTGKALLNKDMTDELDIHFDQQVAVSQFYPQKGVIALNPYQPKAELVILLTKELRKNWQYRNGLLLNPLRFDPNEAVLLNRSQQADCLLMAIRVAWELKLDHKDEVWNYLSASSSSDVMRVFEIHAREDFRSLNNGQATRAAYDKWFEGTRIKLHDKSVIHQMLLDEKIYASDTGRKHILDDSLMIRMAEMPCGQNYLSLAGHKHPTHEDYSAVEDRSNANFLWFIKFERSFQEKERQMLEDNVVCSAEVVDFATKAREMRVR